MITMLLAGTVFHQILVVELPTEGKVSLSPRDARHRLLSESETRALADSLAGAGARLVTAPSLLEAVGEGAELRVSSDDTMFRMSVRESRGTTQLELHMNEGRKTVDLKARFAVPRGSTFTFPIDAHHLLIGRQDVLADGETPEIAAEEFRKSWAGFLGDD